MKTIVISAVNIRKGGTLTILRSCLEYLSKLAESGDYRIVAIVHRKELVSYPRIEYIEKPQIIKSWFRRLWCEYITMHRISKELAPVSLWLSLHDTTPRVRAERRAVYCQTSFPFLHVRWNDLRFDYKIVLFAWLTRFAYRWNIRENNYLIVQAEWLRKGFSRMFGLPEDKFVVFPPRQTEKTNVLPKSIEHTVYTFLFAATPDCHKNFEAICQAAQLLEEEMGENRFQIILTIDGKENHYSHWLHEQWGHLSSLHFAGFMTKTELYNAYAESDCLLFPSRIETWGLPISEFATFGKPMLLANLPYAHEAAAGSRQTAFFNPENPEELKEQMKRLMTGDVSLLKEVECVPAREPRVESWELLFNLFLQ